MGTFTMDFSSFAIRTKEQMRRVVKKVVLDLYSDVIRRSPVDTGRFRANHQIDLNNMNATTIMEFKGKGKKAQVTFPAPNAAQGVGKLEAYELGETVFIYNNVEYAMELEFGHSQQAPQGVYRMAVMDLVARFDEAVRAAK